ncbi:MAG: hypothetical protein ACYC5J_15215, partial [Chloroflexota bacterium]
MTPSRHAQLILRLAVGAAVWFSKLVVALIIGGAALLLVGETVTRLAIADGVDRFEGEERVAAQRALQAARLGCGSEPVDALMRRRFQVVDVRMV